MAIRKLGILGRTYRHAQRYRQILGVLLKYGFSDLVHGLPIEQHVEIGLRKLRVKKLAELGELSRAERIRRLLEELGPTFVKLGQILSTRPDLLPVELLAELPKLQDHVPAFPFDEVRRIVEEELGRPLEERFARFVEEPLAAASIAQVHRATLLDGDEVVVKVQRPGVERTIEVDLEIMLHLAGLAERYLDGWALHQPTRVVEELGRALVGELDFRSEAANLDRFAWQMTGVRWVYVPRVYHRASTARVLTMEYVDGVKAKDLEAVAAAGLDRVKLAARCAEATMKQIFVDGFFHADPHPGNVFFLPRNVICFLDFGQVGRIDSGTRESFADLVQGIVQRDARRATLALLALTSARAEPDERALERDVGEFIDRHFYRPLEKLELGKLLQQLLEIAGRHQLRISPELFLMIKALSSVEGLCRRLDPDFRLTERAAPVLKRVQLEKLVPRRLLADLAGSGGDAARLLREIPSELRSILKQLRRGKTQIGFLVQGIEPLTAAYDRVSNRLAFAIVLGALIVGSSLIVLAGVPPLFHEIPIIGLAGYVVAAIMGFWLLVSILKHGRM
ncbi:MAG: AarF/ABC1/UbiB kinase family protein [Acidobacteria bacterium]|nr:MAG: AarF/ABC1/UbiB kinase family protein [Acidobacteriota bacterium]